MGGPRAGFTLVEMTIAAALMALILGAAYACLNAGIAAQRLIDPRVEATQAGRVALALLTADLRCACPLSKNVEFVGNDRRVGETETDGADFGTHHYTPARPGDGDFCQTSYFVEPDPESGQLVLWRRRNPRIGLDPFQGGSREEIARDVRQFKLEYYDGFEWFDSWGDPDGRRQAREANSLRTEPNLLGLPTAVRITLALGLGRTPRRAPEAATAPGPGTAETDAREERIAFQTVARIQVPATAAGSGTGAAPGGEGASPETPGPGAVPGFPGAGG